MSRAGGGLGRARGCCFGQISFLLEMLQSGLGGNRLRMPREQILSVSENSWRMLHGRCSWLRDLNGRVFSQLENTFFPLDSLSEI